MAKLSYSQAIRETIAQEMRRDERVFVMGEDVEKLGGVYGCTRDLYKEFGTDRVRNTPISESAIIGAALGAASGGMRPIAELMYWDFAFVAADQIFNQVAKTRYVFGGHAKIPLVIRGQQGTGRGNAATHSQSLESLFMHIPGLKVVCPSTPADAAGLLRTAIRDDNPVCFFEHKVLYATKGEVPDDPDFCIPFGKPLLGASLGAAIGGVFGAIVDLKQFSWAGPGLMTCATYISPDGDMTNFFFCLATIAIAAIAGFAMTMLVSSRNKKMYD